MREGALKTALVASGIAIAFLLALEGALHLAGSGFAPTFFIRGEDGNLHANRQFGRLFFPERLVREGVAVRLVDPKPAGTFRIFVLGESAAMGFPSPRFGFPRVLQGMLRQVFPGKKIEVINVAMAGINSHAIRRIARECAQLEPDAFVINMGNNEVVGPFGPGTIFGGTTTSLVKARAAMALRTTKIGQLLDSWMDGRDKTRWGGMEMFTGRRIPQDHPSMPAVYENFRRNLRDILALTKEQPTILCTIAVNLEDFPPLAGNDARRVYAEAEAAAALGDEAKARTLFSQARDLDELRFRADSEVNRIVREESARPNVALVDAEEIFAGKDAGRRDANLFWEHVHLDFPGNCLLARSVATALTPVISSFFGVKPRPLPNDTSIARKIGYTSAEELHAAGDIARMMSRLPFSDQPGNEVRRRALAERGAKLAAASKAEDLSTLETDLDAEVAQYPEDPWLRVALASVLEAQGNKAAALKEKRTIARLIPYDVTALTNLGKSERAAGNLAEARIALHKASRLDPHFAGAFVELAACAMIDNNPKEAHRILENFLRQEPDNADALLALAQIARYENRKPEALNYLQKILTADPDDPAAQAEMRALKASPTH